MYDSRGKPAHDIDALADAVVRLCWLVIDDADHVREVDGNLMFVGQPATV